MTTLKQTKHDLGMTVLAHRWALNDAADMIEKFEAKCEAAEYTDTADVWELLYTLRNRLRIAARNDQE